MARWVLPALGAGAALAGRELLARRTAAELRGQVALVTGGSRGLGLALAQELARQGCRLVVCGRDAATLERARKAIEALGAEVLAVACDISDRQQARQLVGQATERFGRVDLLVNNAGVITVGPAQTQTLADFEEAMGIMFWGTVYPTLEVLPQMRARRGGRIVNVTSIGGKVSVPHLLSYSAAKFAAVGFSEGLRAELARDGISVTTVVPGLMRTGSHLNATFKGQHRAEFALFSPLASLPLTSMSGEKAARSIVAALRRGEAELILTWQAGLLARVHGLMPGLTCDALGLLNRLLPGPGGIGERRLTGSESRSRVSDSLLTMLGERAARALNQYRP